MDSKNRRCELCKHLKIKSKFLGGTKYLCTVQHREVAKENVCSEYIIDTDKLLQRAGFKPHVYGSPDSCETCAYCESAQGKTGTIYSCQKTGVRFWPGFDCMKYICDYFQDGGEDALIARLADVIVENERRKKGEI